MTTLKIQPGPVESYDTFVDEANPATNYKDSTIIALAAQPTYKAQALIQFDLSSLPPGATVTKATLGVYCDELTGSDKFKVYEIVQPWYIDTICWNNRPIQGTPGIPAIAVAKAWILIDVLAIVQDWLATPAYNLGVQLVPPLCDISDIHIVSGDYLIDPTLRPYLELTYTAIPIVGYCKVQTVSTTNGFIVTDTDFELVNDLALTVINIPAGARAKVSFAGMVYLSSHYQHVHLDIDVDGTRIGGKADGVMAVKNNSVPTYLDVSFSICSAPLSAGDHIFTLCARVDSVEGLIVGNDVTAFLTVEIIPDINYPLPVTPASVFPVGAVYCSVVDTDPAVYFGGTWARIAQGKCLVGLNEADADFDVAEEEGGEKTHQLIIAELAAHTHNVGATQWADGSIAARMGLAGSDNAPTGSTGSNKPHNNLQPYLVVYMWKRTA